MTATLLPALTPGPDTGASTGTGQVRAPLAETVRPGRDLPAPGATLRDPGAGRDAADPLGVTHPRLISANTVNAQPDSSTKMPSPYFARSRRPPFLSDAAPRITGMRKWQGYIHAVSEDGSEFTAELIPLDNDGPSVVAEFDMERVAEADREDMLPGASFYFAARTVDGPTGRALTSSIRVRRLGRWTAEDVAGIAEQVKKDRAWVDAFVD